MQPIKDAQGRIEMIVDFDFDPDIDTEYDELISDSDSKRWFGHRTKSIKLLNHYESKYGFRRHGMTSHTKTSLTGFLSVTQVEKLARDKRVSLITENESVAFSSFFLASDSISSSESKSWGWALTTNNNVLDASTSERRVYVVDSGVADHVDLNVVQRTNVSCGNGAITCSSGDSVDEFPHVGCYPHATHVSGIIGARANNLMTSVGIYPNVKLVSVAVTKATTGTYFGQCSNSGPLSDPTQTGTTLSAIGYAFDWIYQTTRIRNVSNDFRVPIVAMSINGGRIGFNNSGVTETNRIGLLKLVNPATPTCAPPRWGSKVCVQNVPYPGAFFVQSAGNIGDSSCNSAGSQCQNVYRKSGKNVCTEFRWDGSSLAYKPAANSMASSETDGIMVVGGMLQSGRAASNSPNVGSPSGEHQFEGYRNSAGQFALPNDRYSNFGACVDVWAPGNLIYSTWGNHFATDNKNSIVGVQYSGNGNASNSTSGWLYLSGTSMAAPHVAGAAAYLADFYNLTSPASIELAVRNRLHPTGYSDSSNTQIKFVQLP
jgi:subtilisin family serine protease